MPIMDGVTFLSHLRRREDTELIPFILLTARSSDEDKVDGLLLGADGTPVLCQRPSSSVQIES
jgi:two-component system alkaline phosphatase synthesis response regulator PhoP